MFAPPSPPEIAASFQPRGRHLKVPTETSRPPKIQEAASPSPALEPPRPLRRHRVVDGDSLESLAERYLKDRSRYLEIYQLNREVLSDWRLLPVGAELTIPPRIRSATIRTGSTQPPVFEGLAESCKAWVKVSSLFNSYNFLSHKKSEKANYSTAKLNLPS